MLRNLILATTAMLAVASAAQAGRVVANGDEWTLSNAGYSNAGAANADRFAKNVASFLTGGNTGNILISSSNFGLTESNLLASLAGYTVTVNAGLPLTAANLAGFDAVFLAANYPDAAETAELISYVGGGGGIYIAAGTGVGGAAAEAAAWNAIVNAFGLSYGSAYDGFGGNFASAFAHPIFSGVSQLFYNNGNPVSDLLPGDPEQEVYGSGFIGIYEDAGDVPAPATIALFGLGVVALGAFRRR